MNLAIFCAIVARERETDRGDDISALEGIGRTKPLLAWPLTIGFLALAGMPGTTGFIGKLFLIEATVEADYTWLGVMIVIGTMVSLAYYLRVLAAVWMRAEPASPRSPARSPGGRRPPTPPGERAARQPLRAGRRRGPHLRRRHRLLRRHPRSARRLGLGRGRVAHHHLQLVLASTPTNERNRMLLAEYTFGQGLLTVL